MSASGAKQNPCATPTADRPAVLQGEPFPQQSKSVDPTNEFRLDSLQ